MYLQYTTRTLDISKRLVNRNFSRPGQPNSIITSAIKTKLALCPNAPATHRIRTFGEKRSLSSLSGLSPIFAVLLLAGVSVTTYGAYSLYGTLTLWPPEVRVDLRDGLTAKYKGNLELSEQYLLRAWDTAKRLPLELFKTQPHLKTSGIAVCLAGVMESNNKPEKAYDIYVDALTRLQDFDVKRQLSGPEMLRAVAISYKLGEMARLLQRPLEEQERWLVWAVEAILRSYMSGQWSRSSIVQTSESAGQVSDSDIRLISELELPNWIAKTDVAAPFEALGSFYSQTGKLDYAMPLYLQAISFLMPPPPQVSSVEDICKGAQLMTNLSELIVRNDANINPETLHQAEIWAAKALDVVIHSRGKTSQQYPSCETAFAVALFNVGVLRKMAGDNKKAREYISLSLKQSKTMGMQLGISHAEDAMRQLDALEGSVYNPPESKTNL